MEDSASRQFCIRSSAHYVKALNELQQRISRDCERWRERARSHGMNKRHTNAKDIHVNRFDASRKQNGNGECARAAKRH